MTTMDDNKNFRDQSQALINTRVLTDVIRLQYVKIMNIELFKLRFSPFWSNDMSMCIDFSKFMTYNALLPLFNTTPRELM